MMKAAVWMGYFLMKSAEQVRFSSHGVQVAFMQPSFCALLCRTCSAQVAYSRVLVMPVLFTFQHVMRLWWLSDTTGGVPLVGYHWWGTTGGVPLVGYHLLLIEHSALQWTLKVGYSLLLIATCSNVVDTEAATEFSVTVM